MSSCSTAATAINQDVEDIIKPFKISNDPAEITKIQTIVREMTKEINFDSIQSEKEAEQILTAIKKRNKCIPNNMNVLYEYKKSAARGETAYDKRFEEILQTKSFRSQSGVMVIAVFTSPEPETEKGGVLTKQQFSCEYDCYYCPAEPNQPRSYLFLEPGVHRANNNQFDPVRQFCDRGQQYLSMGHPMDKIELIVLGGTWSSYPKDYQDRFIRDVFYAANTFYSDADATRIRQPKSLEEEQLLNETGECRIIGLTLETRPDRINAKELQNFRRLGVTRIQMGVQHTNDRILERINRRCSSNHAIKAIKMAKDCCFKVDIHLMPDLPQPLLPHADRNKPTAYEPSDIDYSVDMVEEDRKMFDLVINHPDWQADQWKIYPCEVVPWTRLKLEYENGAYKTYGDQDMDHRKHTPLIDLLIDVHANVKPWVRLNRVVRDIPTDYISGGNYDISMRQKIDNAMKRRGLYCMDIRNREVKKRNISTDEAVLRVRTYEASGGTEYFLSFETADERILFGFLRLRLSPNAGAGGVFPELENTALIRELHVYGSVKKVGKGEVGVQHSGFGRKLVNAAFDIAAQHDYTRIAVISGIGVKNYYRKFGFEDEGAFMIAPVEKDNQIPDGIIFAALIVYISILVYIMINYRPDA